MGITGLLKGLSPLLIPENAGAEIDGKMSTSKPVYNIRQFKNKSLAVDASSWLYKACYSTSARLVEAIEADKKDHICEKIICKYMLKRCEELLSFAGVRRIHLVFDGKRCPLKAVTNQEREAKRRKNLEEARRLSGLGMKDQANDKYKACIKVLPWMAESVAKAVAQKWKKRNGFIDTKAQVTCVFSPFEADAQLVKLCIEGQTDAIVTEDSDVLVYSAACNVSFPIIYKLDRNTGGCDVVSMDWLLVRSPSSRSLNTEGSFSIRRFLPSQLPAVEAEAKKKSKNKKAAGNALLSHLVAIANRESRHAGAGARMFVQACVLAGCDYAPSRVSGVGLVTAFKMIKENVHRDPHCRFFHTLKSVSKDKFLPVVGTSTEGQSSNETLLRDDYEEIMAKSECVFYFHPVLDRNGKIVPLIHQFASASMKEEFHDYLPSIERFDDDSFLGDLNDKTPTKRKVTILKSSPIKNPYSTSKAQKTNTFSSFMHKTTPNLETKRMPLVSTLMKSASSQKADRLQMSQNNCDNDESSVDDILEEPDRSSSIIRGSYSRNTKNQHNEDRKEPLWNDYSGSDNSSSDELDDVLEPITRERILSRSKRPRSNSSASSIPSMSSPEGDRRSHAASKSCKSKYFGSQEIPHLKTASVALPESKKLRIVTPTTADLKDNKEGYFSSSDDNMMAPTSKPGRVSRPETKQATIDESSDDDDCIIIESSTRAHSTKITMTNNQHSMLRSSINSRSGIFSSTFAKAQNEGTRARMFSKIKRQKDKQKNCGALGKSTKRIKTASIKGFFKSLPTSIE